MLRSILGLAALILFLAQAGLARASIVLAQTDFGTTDGTSVSPFSTDYPTPMGTSRPADTYYEVAVNGAGHSWSYSDWTGFDHTNPMTGAWMVVNGSTDSSKRILDFTTNTVGGLTYTWSGWVREINAPLVELSFQVNGVQQGTFFSPPQGSTDWVSFTFSYTAPTSGTNTVFSLNDLQTSSNDNDFGLDDLVLSSNASVAGAPEPASLAIWGLGALGCAVVVHRRRKLAVA
jgi:hypothetical protein